MKRLMPSLGRKGTGSIQNTTLDKPGRFMMLEVQERCFTRLFHRKEMLYQIMCLALPEEQEIERKDL